MVLKMAEESRNDWYVAIISMGSGYIYHFIGVGSSSYQDFKEISKNRKSGMRVLAEQFDVSDEVCVRLSSGALEELVKKVRAGEKFDVQKELSKLCTQ